MQANMAQAQEQLAQRYFSAQGAGGKIEATANGAGMITALKIDPAIIDPDDAEFLSELVLKTVQEALLGAKNMAETEMSKLTGGLGFPM